ncbi:hypothetical protein ONZ51_g9801 [Trametes cubensis]|uniref:Uncharacterized protein n=1 Tax=Trametes cubensis TaxID=1111947 RepID=A0AAD7TL50_9APHY|nr:hypothetical protein ONZ51_g9801 [Trametes cubensis]
MSRLLHSCRRNLILIALAASLAVGAAAVLESEKGSLVVSDADVQACEPVQQLSALKEELEAAQSPIMRQVFSWLFPFGPGWNSGASPTQQFGRTPWNVLHILVRTALPPPRSGDPEANDTRRRCCASLMCSVPNFILAFIPAQINPNTLNTMTAFAVRTLRGADDTPALFYRSRRAASDSIVRISVVRQTGGLLSDVFLHLVPHSFMGEHQDGGVHFVMVEEKRNILIGLGIFVGFASFFIMEKTLRVLGGGEDGAGHSHSHSHSHNSEPVAAQTNGHSTAVSAAGSTNGLKSRGSDKTGSHETNGNAVAETSEIPVAQTSKLSAYLNLFGDFVHNITDGLAYVASAKPWQPTFVLLNRALLTVLQHGRVLLLFAAHRGDDDPRMLCARDPPMRSPTIRFSTFMGIGIRNLSAAAEVESHASDLAAAIRQTAAGLLGTTVQLADLVRPSVPTSA